MNCFDDDEPAIDPNTLSAEDLSRHRTPWFITVSDQITVFGGHYLQRAKAIDDAALLNVETRKLVRIVFDLAPVVPDSAIPQTQQSVME